MRARPLRARSVLTVAGGLVAALLAGLLALAINIGILRAAGSPHGPGRLDRTSVDRPMRVGPAVRPAPAWSPRPRHGGRPAPREREFGSNADD